MNKTLDALTTALGPDVVSVGPVFSNRATTGGDPSPDQMFIIVRPATTEQVAALLRLCNDLGQPVVPIGGLTGLVGGTRARPDEVLLSLERMNAIEEIDPIGLVMKVQAGALLQTVQDAAAAHGLIFPLDLAARGSCTIGGNIATNAGGVRVLRYGMMRSLVLGLEATLADGSVVTSLNKMLKNNAGYDLKQIFIGAEGTLGVVTRATLRLWPRPSSVSTALLAAQRFDQVVGLLELAQRAIGSTLASFEVMWNEYYRLTTTPPALSKPPLGQEHPFYVLLESLGGDPAGDGGRFEAALDEAQGRGFFEDGVVAKSQQQRAALWRIREDSEQVERQYKPAFGFDVSLPINAMQRYIEDLRQSLKQELGAVCWVFGHLADGNLHINVWAPGGDERAQQRVEELVYQPLGALGGSVSAEHGIGLDKRAYLHLCRSDAEIALMRRLKQALDPRNILNPGKVLPE